ncbi:MAG: U32 family peptidase [Planctomycetota bacterium]|nr:MAG: U32 family peptidase [Planctomycetota bacterium]
MDFHLSTQASVCNSWDVAEAAELGIKRVVLAREMTLDEIACASRAAPVETEVFAQGALCFSVSGRCMMSSWVGGRSGNRGTCTSPCRVPWALEGMPIGRPLSMHDWCTVDRIDELEKAGVAALKIEGRLKNDKWVAKAVSLYRSAIDATNDPARAEVAADLRARAEELTGYSGRSLTAGYLDGRFTDLTGEDRGRDASAARPLAEENTFGDDSPEPAEHTPAAQTATGYRLTVLTGGRSIECKWEWGDACVEWTLPKTVVRRPKKAMRVGDLLGFLSEYPLHGVAPAEMRCDDAEFLVVPRAANAVIDRIAAEIHRARKRAARPKQEDLPAWATAAVQEWEPSKANDRHLGKTPNRVRLHVDRVDEFRAGVNFSRMVLEGATSEWLTERRRLCRRLRPVIALPPVAFEDSLADLERLLKTCRDLHLAVEVNSWGQLRAAREAGCRFETGPGLAVLNSLAVAQLRELGARCVTVSPEADRRQLERLSQRAPAALAIYVFSRPVLAVSRVELPAEFLEREFADRRGLRMIPRRESGLWTFRSADPFDWRDIQNENIRARYLVVDLTASPDPVGEWLQTTRSTGEPFRFNYDRTLK